MVSYYKYLRVPEPKDSRTHDLRSGTVRVYLETDEPPMFGKEVIYLPRTLLRAISSSVQIASFANPSQAERRVGTFFKTLTT
jgi:hypothetical protein